MVDRKSYYLRHQTHSHIIGEEVDLKEHDIEVAAALLKVFIRELPVPLITVHFSEVVGALPGN